MFDGAGPTLLIPLLASGFGVAFLHAVLPTHWLPFVLVGRAQRWSLGMTLVSVLASGLAHIAATAAVGGLIVVAGLALEGWVSGLLPWRFHASIAFNGGIAARVMCARHLGTAARADRAVPRP